MRGSVRRWLVLAGGGILIAACTPVLAPDQPAGDDQGLLGFQDCEPPYAFEGESTMAALGIEAEGLTHELTMRGHIRITRDAVTHEEFAPPGVPVVVPEGQVLCIEWADGGGGGMAMMLRQPWPPPGVGAAMPGAGGSTPLVPVLVGVAVVVIGVVSWLAFRRDARPTGTDR